MRDFERQAMVVRPFIYLIVSWIVFFILAMILLVPKFMPDDSIAVAVMSVGFLGKYVGLIIESSPILLSTMLILVSVLFLLPLALCVRAVRKRYHKSNFPEGLDVSKLKKEDYFIYISLKKFLAKAGLKIIKGFGADEVVTSDNTHFGSIKFIREKFIYEPSLNNRLYHRPMFLSIFARERFIHKSIYLLINQSFKPKGTGIPDRSGFISIPYAQDLPAAKRRIAEVYNTYYNKKQ